MFTISYTTSDATSHTMFDCLALGIRLAAFRARIQAAFKFGNAMIYCSAQHTNQAHQSSSRDGRSRRGVRRRRRRRRLSTAGRRPQAHSTPIKHTNQAPGTAAAAGASAGAGAGEGSETAPPAAGASAGAAAAPPAAPSSSSSSLELSDMV